MKRIANFIVDKRKSILIVFVLLTVTCAVMIPFVEINYDQSVYLPHDSDTFKGLAVMQDEFGAPGSMSVMVKEISLVQAAKLRKELETVEHVSGAMFLDTLLLSMKTDAEQSDDDYIAEMFDMLGLVYQMQGQYFPDRSLGYVYDKMMSFAKNFSDLGKIPVDGFPTDLGIFGGSSGTETLSLFGDGGQGMSNIDSSSLDMLEGYYKNGAALVSITMEYSDFDSRTQDAVKSVSEVAKDYGSSQHYTGQSAAAYFNRRDSEQEMLVIGIIAVLIILVILFLTTTSWLEPLLYFGVIVVAIALNMGTNLFVGSISNMTNMIGALLQLALSIDYSIFLLHTFNAEKKKTPDKVAAMKSALAKSLSPISASSLTTIASFVALMFMTFKLGLNFGLVLGKGIAFSLVTVFLLMPGFVIGMDKALTRTQHRSPDAFVRDLLKKRRERKAAQSAAIGIAPAESRKQKAPRMERYAKLLDKLKVFVPAFFVILMVPMFFFQQNNEFFFGEYQDGSLASSYMRDVAEVKAVFGRQNTGVILYSNQYEDKETELCDRLDDFSFILSVMNYDLMTANMEEDSIPMEMKSQFKGVNYNRVILALDLADEGDESFLAIEKIERILLDTFGEDGDYYLLGGTKSIYEICNYSISDNLFISMLTLAFILVILAFTFRSFGITLILGMIIQAATWMNMAVPFIMGNAMHFIGYVMVSGVQMGATIDYGILLTNNYMHARKTKGKIAAIQEALSLSFTSILTAGSILMTVGFAVGIVTTSITTEVMGMALGRGALISTICMLFVLPQALLLLDKFIMYTTYKGKKNMLSDIKEQTTRRPSDISLSPMLLSTIDNEGGSDALNDLASAPLAVRAAIGSTDMAAETPQDPPDTIDADALSVNLDTQNSDITPKKGE